MILYKNTKAMVRSPDGDTEFVDITAGVLQGDTLAPFLFIICLDYVLRTSVDLEKGNGLTLQKPRSRRYPSVHITDADYADDLALFADTVTQAESLLHGLEKAAKGIGLQVHADKTEYMCYKQDGQITSSSGKDLKKVDQFTYLGSNISSTESDVNIRIGKAWATVNKLTKIWKSTLPARMKRDFFQATVLTVLLYGCTAWTLTKCLESKIDGNCTRMLRTVLNTSWQRHPTKQYLYGQLSPVSQTIRERRTRFAGHCWRSKEEIVSDVLLWTPKHGHTRAGHPERTYITQLSEDCNCLPEDLPNLMDERNDWRARVMSIRASSTSW